MFIRIDNPIRYEKDGTRLKIDKNMKLGQLRKLVRETFAAVLSESHVDEPASLPRTVDDYRKSLSAAATRHGAPTEFVDFLTGLSGEVEGVAEAISDAWESVDSELSDEDAADALRDASHDALSIVLDLFNDKMNFAPGHKGWHPMDETINDIVRDVIGKANVSPLKDTAKMVSEMLDNMGIHNEISPDFTTIDFDPLGFDLDAFNEEAQNWAQYLEFDDRGGFMDIENGVKVSAPLDGVINLSLGVAESVEQKKTPMVIADDVDELPVDYEACGTCGYDHSYEPEEAARVPHDLNF